MMGWRRIEGECWVGEEWNQKCRLIYSMLVFSNFQGTFGRVSDPAESGNGNAGSLTLPKVVGGEVGKGVGKFGVDFWWIWNGLYCTTAINGLGRRSHIRCPAL